MICHQCGELITCEQTEDEDGTLHGFITCRIEEGKDKGRFVYFHEKCADEYLMVVPKNKEG